MYLTYINIHIYIDIYVNLRTLFQFYIYVNIVHIWELQICTNITFVCVGCQHVVVPCRTLIISAKFEHFSLISLGEFIAAIPHLDVIESIISCMKCAYLQFHSHTLVCENCCYNSCNVKIVPWNHAPKMLHNNCFLDEVWATMFPQSVTGIWECGLCERESLYFYNWLCSALLIWIWRCMAFMLQRPNALSHHVEANGKTNRVSVILLVSSAVERC